MSETPCLTVPDTALPPAAGTAIDDPSARCRRRRKGFDRTGAALGTDLSRTRPRRAERANRYDQRLCYQWISSGIRVEADAVEAVKAAADILNAFIDEELRSTGLGPQNLALIGFSQGTMMSFYTAPRRDHPIAGILGYSGRIVGANLMAAETKACRPSSWRMAKIRCCRSNARRGATDPRGMRFLRVQTAALNLGHSIDENGLVQGTNFLRTIFGV